MQAPPSPQEISPSSLSMTPTPFLEDDAMTLRRYCLVEEAFPARFTVTEGSTGSSEGMLKFEVNTPGAVGANLIVKEQLPWGVTA